MLQDSVRLSAETYYADNTGLVWRRSSASVKRHIRKPSTKRTKTEPDPIYLLLIPKVVVWLLLCTAAHKTASGTRKLLLCCQIQPTYSGECQRYRRREL